MRIPARLRRPVRGAVVTFAIATVVAGPTTPAHANGERCTSSNLHYSCVNVSGGTASGYIGAVTSSFPVWDWTVAVQQCDGYGQNCTLFASRSGSFASSVSGTTTSNPASFGHTYRTVASWTDQWNNRSTYIISPLSACGNPC